MECSSGASRTKWCQGQKADSLYNCNYLYKDQPDRSISSRCFLNNVPIPNHFKPVSLRTHAAYLGMRTRYQQDLIYSFLKFLLPQSLPTPTGTSCLLSFTPPHITTEPPQHAELWQEASMHLKATAIRM